ncbi:MAG TPA: hypothetical protein VFQ72_02375 [Candidatus Paceibacterota bacterium]|nr:hypothetical protein [Candidatus Paceibacterota bacterium]
MRLITYVNLHPTHSCVITAARKDLEAGKEVVLDFRSMDCADKSEYRYRFAATHRWGSVFIGALSDGRPALLSGTAHVFALFIGESRATMANGPGDMLPEAPRHAPDAATHTLAQVQRENPLFMREAPIYCPDPPRFGCAARAAEELHVCMDAPGENSGPHAGL